MGDGPGIDWSRIKLVAFDVDGTLYAQRPLRLRVAAALIRHTVKSRNTRTMAVLKTYRTLREELGDTETPDFDRILLDRVAQHHALSPGLIREIVAEWMEQRPLGSLARCRYPAVDRLFERIRASGRLIGILSDYPAHAKLQAMTLSADHVVSAGEVGLLKPHPRGLQRLMELAGTAPEETILIGDRDERDGAAARRAGTACLLRSRKPVPGVGTFTRFDDPIFDGVDYPLVVSSVTAGLT
jgi:putative hydrolase of the HAD superfamily